LCVAGDAQQKKATNGTPGSNGVEEILSCASINTHSKEVLITVCQARKCTAKARSLLCVCAKTHGKGQIFVVRQLENAW
jgi:hypothetical protein